MKLKELIEAASGQELLLEKLGNLTALNAAPLFKRLITDRQRSRKEWQRGGGGLYKEHGADQPLKYDISADSVITDAGELKTGAGLRAAIKALNRSRGGFVIYRNDQAAALGMIYSDIIEDPKPYFEIYRYLDGEIEHTGANLSSFTNLIRSLSSDDWKKGDLSSRPAKQVKVKASTASTKRSAWDDQEETKPKITVKLITASGRQLKRRQARELTKEQVLTAGQRLAKRLERYKLTKHPTVANIKEFAEKVFDAAFDEVRFGDLTYKTSENDRNYIIPTQIIKGKPFTLKFIPVPLKTDSWREGYDREHKTIELGVIFKDGSFQLTWAKWYAPDGKRYQQGFK